MAAFNMKVIIYDPYISDSVVAPGIIRYSSEEQVYKEADVLTLHVPMNNETRNHVNENLLSLLKPSAFLINTARGAIVDEVYLAKMLHENKLAGAGFDVMANEPPLLSDELINAPYTIISPHSAALTKECMVRVACEAATGIADYLEGRTPKFIFNRKELKM